ncbi:beta-N-acetylhexosaminidase [Barnesiella intestinihominis]|uniref:beta-N-acetylhexosaminidase n=1 Tax=Barnesiella intestinihominis TaxID=487174 RepID=UPI0026DCEAF0|nr:family 20 glycosylhydrolase [Barnesiella intestinihominis]
MKIRKALVLGSFLFCASFCIGAPVANTFLPVVPVPAEYSVGEGYFYFNADMKFGVENESQLRMVSDFATLLGRQTGFVPSIMIGSETADVRLETVASLPDEAYNLVVTSEKILIESAGDAGFFYALQSLRQLLPVGVVEGKKQNRTMEYKIPVMTVNDRPRFGYRGLMIDVSRYFMPKHNLLNIIDAASFLKINKIHLHLVDDNGWRLEIKKYPRLTQVGAWRVKRDEPFPNRRNQEEGEPVSVGGYYTQDDMREIIRFAALRQIEIIPEIEMPAHTNSSLAAYPELACSVVDRFIGVLPGIGGKNSEIVYCAGNDSVFSFLEDVIDEVSELFPSKYIHLGGDEASKVNWAKCPKCRARMEAEHIEHTEELQSYFMTRMSNYVRSKGKEVMGWDELTNSTLPEGAIIYGWQGFGKAALKAAAKGHRFIMTPARILYFIRYQGPQWFEPLTYFGNNTLKDVYTYEPVQEDWNPVYEDLLMGVQASMWTEFCNSPDDVEYQLFPRLLALSDIAWAKKGTKDWPDFLKRIDKVLPHIEAMDITCARSMYNIDHKVTPKGKKLMVELSCIRPDVEIRYTEDGTEPVASSSLYASPLTVKSTTCMKAATFMNGEKMGETLLLDLQWNKATGKEVLASNEKRYVLTNGVRGSLRHTDFEWAGWYDEDASFVLDMGKRTPVKEVRIGCITNSGMAVHKPSLIRLSVSNNKKTFVPVREITFSQEDIFKNRTAVEDAVFSGLDLNARYLKLEMENPGLCPIGDIREDQKIWMYFDELIVN